MTHVPHRHRQISACSFASVPVSKCLGAHAGVRDEPRGDGMNPGRGDKMTPGVGLSLSGRPAAPAGSRCPSSGEKHSDATPGGPGLFGRSRSRSNSVSAQGPHTLPRGRSLLLPKSAPQRQTPMAQPQPEEPLAAPGPSRSSELPLTLTPAPFSAPSSDPLCSSEQPR